MCVATSSLGPNSIEKSASTDKNSSHRSTQKNCVITRAFLGVKTPTADKPLISLFSLDVLSSTGLSLCNIFRDKSVAMTTCLCYSSGVNLIVV